MIKKKTLLFLTSALIGTLIISFAVVGTNKNAPAIAINNDYELIFDKNTRKPTLSNTLSSNEYDIKTNLENILSFKYENATDDTNGFITLNNGSFYNPYNPDVKDSNAISGIKNIVVDFTGSNTLKIEYGIESASSTLTYSNFTNITQNQNTFNFNNDYPSYFKISNANGEISQIKSIKLQYTCKKNIDPSFYNNVKFQEINGSYCVTDYTGNPREIIIPNYYNGLPVRAIYTRAFAYCRSLESIVLPDNITNIENEAFLKCESLTSITLGNGLQYIGKKAFDDCASLSSIYIPASVSIIEDEAFSGCRSLVIYTECETKPEGWTENWNSYQYPVVWAYQGKTGQTYDGYKYALYSKNGEKCITILKYSGSNVEVTIPSEIQIDNTSYPVRSINTTAFSFNYSLVTLNIPNTVQSIGWGAFNGCQKLKNVNLSYGLITIDNDAFSNCYSLQSIVIPNSVKTIGARVFQWCNVLKSINIPSSVESIGDGLFIYCTSLESITVSSENKIYDSRNDCNAIIETSTNTLFLGCSNTIIPNGIETLYAYSLSYCSFPNSLTIPLSVKSIEDGAFNSSSVKEVYYPGSEEDWAKITIGTYNESLTRATIHYNSTGPAN